MDQVTDKSKVTLKKPQVNLWKAVPPWKSR